MAILERGTDQLHRWVSLLQISGGKSILTHLEELGALPFFYFIILDNANAGKDNLVSPSVAV